MDLHRNYRMQKCAIHSIIGITVAIEWGIMKINLLKTEMCMGGEKICMEKNYLAVTICFGNEQIWIKQMLKDYLLIENEVYQMMIKKKKRQIKPSENSGSFSLSAVSKIELFFVVYREFHMKQSQR